MLVEPRQNIVINKMQLNKILALQRSSEIIALRSCFTVNPSEIKERKSKMLMTDLVNLVPHSFSMK